MNDKKRWISVNCPYCGKTNQITVDPLGELEPKMALCDIENQPAGCDKYFAFTVTFYPSTIIYKMQQFPEVSG